MSQDKFSVLDSDALINEGLLGKKIYGSCKQQDCLKPVDINTPLQPANYLRIDSSVYGGTTNLQNNPSTATSPLLSTPILPGSMITFDNTVKSVKVVSGFTTTVNIVSVDAPGQFSLPGCYTVTVQYTFKYNITLYNASGAAISLLVDSVASNTIPASTTYTKMISLEGGVVDCSPSIAIADNSVTPQSSTSDGKPYAYVQAIASPIVGLVGKYLGTSTTACPNYVYHADIVIGLFTIIYLYRYTAMNLVSNGPLEIYPCQPSIINDPCYGFNQLVFPYDDFDPPYGQCCK
jgi:hypothetical protein